MPAFPSQLSVPAAAFAASLLDWYDASRRALPWREDRNWYRVWVSEIMLQQTTVKAVVPYFEAFVRAFPDVRTLAAANEDEVLAAWAGLGYYSRARNLLKTAQVICRDHQCEFPAHFALAVALPGIGRYTAGAILSIVYGLPLPAIDGNVSRVLARYLAYAEEWNSASSRALWDLLSGLLRNRSISRRVGDFNQALMELGATICTPRNPECPACPLAASCQARRLSLQDSIPPKRRLRPRVAVDCTVALIRSGSNVLMCQTQAGLFPKGLWELPRIPGRPGEGWESKDDLRLQMGDILGTVVHGITHHRITIHVVQAQLVDGNLPNGCAWVNPQSPRVGVSAYVRKVLGLFHSRARSEV